MAGRGPRLEALGGSRSRWFLPRARSALSCPPPGGINVQHCYIQLENEAGGWWLVYWTILNGVSVFIPAAAISTT
jgi:hypothetical protein